MTDFSHRDRRAHREVNRAFGAVLGVSAGLIVFALVIPLPYSGVAAVVAMSVLGAVYVGWSDRTLDRYTEDLRAAAEGSRSTGFARAETASPVGLYRDGRGPVSRSPHSRRPTASTRERGSVADVNRDRRQD